MRKTKIVMTIGPALMEGNKLRDALKIADVVRLNASHSDCDSRTPVLEKIRETLEELGRQSPIFLDIQGPKWRLGTFETPFNAPDGSVGAFYPVDGKPPAGAAWSAPVPHPELFKGAKVGQTWLVDDGALVFEVTEAAGSHVMAKAVTGGLVKQRKGVMPLGLDVQIDPLTKKDLEDAAWGVKHGVDMFALSFVREASDVQRLKDVIQEAGGNPAIPIIAKIEHPKALDNLDALMEVVWGVMVARGDLGVELGVEKVPSLQKRIIRTANRYFRPVITATQMLESMIEHPMPTRAESSDVANAIWDGTDAVMLSAESASGKYPVEAVQWLAKIAEDADAHAFARVDYNQGGLLEQYETKTDANIAMAACDTAKAIGAKYILAFSEGGGMVRMLSHMADTPIIAATTSTAVARRLGVVRGVTTLLVPKAEHLSQLLKLVTPMLKDSFGIAPGDKVVMTIGHPLWTSGTTNTMRVIAF